MSKPKILLYDIETAPVLAYVWALWKQNVAINQIARDSYILCWAAKWLGDNEVISDALPNHKKHYRLYPECDWKVCETLWTLIDEADIVVGHNLDGFDAPRANARFIHHEMDPPSPAKQVDTLKMARQSFGFTSNKLDWLGEHLGVGRKVHHDGFDLWVRCMKGDDQSWEDMVRYCRGDVELLERVYLRLRPWAKTHPNIAAYTDDVEGCPRCTSKNRYANGTRRTLVGKYQRYQCKDCGHWYSGAVNEMGAEDRKKVGRSGHDS